MISEGYIKSIINNEIKNMNLFLVDLKISSSNKINVFIDSMKGVTIEECAKLSFMIKEKLNKHIDDYVLEVSSPGLNKSLILPLQYEKNLGRYLDIITKDGIRKTGRLTKVFRNGIQIKSEVTVKNKQGRKREHVAKDYVFDFTDIKSAKVIVSFN
jgi:ribosome maturation factor RimP